MPSEQAMHVLYYFLVVHTVGKNYEYLIVLFLYLKFYIGKFFFLTGRLSSLKEVIRNLNVAIIVFLLTIFNQMNVIKVLLESENRLRLRNLIQVYSLFFFFLFLHFILFKFTVFFNQAN